MDYIREELLRQQKLLAALMTGGEALAENAVGKATPAPAMGTGRAETEADKASARSGRRAAPAARRYGADGLDEKAESARAAGAGMDADEKGSRADGRGEQREPGGIGSRRTERGRRTAGSGGSAGTLWSAAVGSAGGDADIPISGAIAQWEPAGFAAGGAADARALSRAFQRDARRYDGGFSLY